MSPKQNKNQPMSGPIKKLAGFFRSVISKNTKENNQKQEQKLKDKTSEISLHDKIQEKEKGKEKKEEMEDTKIRNKGKLFVGGLNLATTSKDLECYFSTFGKVVDSIVMRYPTSRRSRGYGFVTFADPKDAQTALDMEIHVLNNKVIDPKPFSTQFKVMEERENARVFLGGLPYNISKDDLKKFFSRYGEVSDVLILHDRNTNMSKGCGFLEFKDKKSAELCISEHFVYVCGRRVQVKKAEPREGGKKSSEIFSSCSAFDGEEEGLDLENFNALTDKEEDETDSEGFLGIRDNVNFQKLVEDFFLAKLAYSNAKSENENWQLKESDVREVEKMFARILMETKKKITSERQNLIEFTDDPDDDDDNDNDNDNDDDDDDDDDEDEDDYYDDNDNECENFLGLYDSFKDSLKNNSEAKNLRRTSVWPDEASAPFNIRDIKGTLMCSLCKYTPEDNSCETFLTHCKTLAHRLKLKERFSSEKTQSDMYSSTEITKPVDKHTEQVSKKQSETDIGKKKKGRRRKKKGPDERTNGEGNIKNPDIHALAAGVACIQPVSENELKCIVCRKTLPKAQDFGIWMKNVSMHLCSKGHVKKMLESADSSKKRLKNKEENKNFTNEAPSPQEKKTGVQKVQRPNRTNEQQSNVCNIKVICLPCSSIFSNTQRFNVHLNSKHHLLWLNKNNISSEVCIANMKKCKNCEIYLYGPLLYINRHFTKCVGNKA